MRVACWAIATALAVAGCERADMKVCQPLPTAYDTSSYAFYHPSDQAIAAEIAAHTKGSETVSQEAATHFVQRSTITACLRRNAYLLTKSGASDADVVEAAVNNCDELIAAETKQYLRPNRPLTDETDKLGRDFYRHEAESMVLEAKAGHCWAQG